MSAIWGYIDMDPSVNNGDCISDIKTKMTKAYEGFVIDRFEEASFSGGFFSCGIQYFSKRASKEVLPVYDSKNGYVFTADIVLNARNELIDEIVKASDNANADELYLEPDGSLAYRAWLLWKENFTDHIQGPFAIAIFDLNSRKFYIFSDHMGNRAINYAVIGEKIYFSTLYLFTFSPFIYKTAALRGVRCFPVVCLL